MIALREVIEIALPAVAFVAAVMALSNSYRRRLRASGRKFKG